MNQDARQAALRQMRSHIDVLEGRQEDWDLTGIGWDSLECEIQRLRNLVRFHEQRAVQRGMR